MFKDEFLNPTSMRIILFYCFCITLSVVMNFQLLAQEEMRFPDSSVIKNENYTIKTFLLSNDTWGYDILKNDKVFIHQPSIPGKMGNQGFITKEMAFSVAELVVKKIRNGESPPSISVEELTKLGCH